MRELADSIRTSLNFYRTQDAAETVELGVVTGAAVAIPGFVERLGEQLRLPLEARVVEAPDGTSTPAASRSPPASRSPSARRGTRPSPPDVRHTARPMSVGVAAVVAAILGAIVGSFLNVVAYRLPRKESLLHPPSACPACGTPIKPYDNVPVLGWLWLRGQLPRLRGADLAAVPARRGRHGPAVRGVRAALRRRQRRLAADRLRAAARADHADRPRAPHHPERPDRRSGRSPRSCSCSRSDSTSSSEHLIAALRRRRLLPARRDRLSRGHGDGRRQARGRDGPLPGPRRRARDLRGADRRHASSARSSSPATGPRRAARRASRSAPGSRSAASSACSRATRSSTGTSTPSRSGAPRGEAPPGSRRPRWCRYQGR